MAVNFLIQTAADLFNITEPVVIILLSYWKEFKYDKVFVINLVMMD